MSADGLGISGEILFIDANLKERSAVRTALPGRTVAEFKKASGNKLLGGFGGRTFRSRNIAAPGEIFIALRQLRHIINALVPFKVDFRTLALRIKGEPESILHRINIRIPAFNIRNLNFARKSQFKEAMHRIHRVRTPVSETSHAEVVPAAPVAVDIMFGIIVRQRLR